MTTKQEISILRTPPKRKMQVIIDPSIYTMTYAHFVHQLALMSSDNSRRDIYAVFAIGQWVSPPTKVALNQTRTHILRTVNYPVVGQHTVMGHLPYACARSTYLVELCELCSTSEVWSMISSRSWLFDASPHRNYRRLHNKSESPREEKCVPEPSKAFSGSYLRVA